MAKIIVVEKPVFCPYRKLTSINAICTRGGTLLCDCRNPELFKDSCPLKDEAQK